MIGKILYARRNVMPCAAVCLFALMCVLEFAVGASTAPIRNRDPHSTTANPPHTAHPIYYPLTTATTANSSNPADSFTPEDLLREFMRRHSALDYPAAAEAAWRLIEAAPDRPEGHYNLACALSKLQRFDEAIAALEQAIRCGWRDLLHMTMDPDLLALRRTPAYNQMVKSLQQKISEERIVPVPLRTSSPQEIISDFQMRAPELLERYHVPGATIALIHQGEMAWMGAFGVGDRRRTTLLKPSDQFPVHAPLHLLAIIAGWQQQHEGGVQLAQLLQQAVEFNTPAATFSHPLQAKRNSKGEFVAVKRSARARLAARRAAQSSRTPYGAVYEFLRTAVEIEGERSFAAYLAEYVFNPLAMRDTTVANAINQTRTVVVGHSRLGSPMQVPSSESEDNSNIVLLTTARDLAQLVQSALQQPDGTSEHVSSTSAAIQTVTTMESHIPGGFGLSLETKQTQYGTRVQVADISMGVGCLMRWYPQHQSGVVVLYNSATGFAAAERLAHLALGGE